MHRLVAYAQNGVQRFAVDRSELLIGSAEECDIHLPYAGVGREHARLHSSGAGVQIEDLGSRKGVLVNGRRVRQASLEVLDEIRLGSIALLLEDVLPESPSGNGDGAAEEPVAEATINAPRMLEHLARISQWVLADSSSSTTLESLVIELLSDFGGGVLFLFQGEEDKRGIKFVVATNERWLGSGDEVLQQVNGADGDPAEVTALPDAYLDEQQAWIAFRSFSALDRPYLLVVALPRFTGGDWSPLPALRTLGDQLILGLVHHVGQFEPILFGRREQAGLTMAPGLVVGESAGMKRALSQLQAAVDPPVHVLLRGEPGVSRELLARSLHLSSSRRDGPFITASCGGAKLNQIEADLFGAEIPGKHEPLVREGKLLMADGGTLYLEDVEHLPFELQDRLVRFIRSGEVEPTESLRSRKVDVRLVAACQEPLETQVARDKFRIDLAYRLAQFTVDVPALRERREDLPLLIQAAVNRCCHQTSKRIQGITVKAMEALAVYDYPGNLPELENIVRRLVYLCTSGAPIDDSMLPEEVRLGKIKGLRPETHSELNLERLVADCERAAIREALRRSNGNKSEAARQLGLSRNGLAMKINRLGLSRPGGRAPRA
ncbi:MAG: sigma 54-interacting transcriptional regulator [Acidobacteriota bacterium]